MECDSTGLDEVGSSNQLEIRSSHGKSRTAKFYLWGGCLPQLARESEQPLEFKNREMGEVIFSNQLEIQSSHEMRFYRVR